ncbi:MAG: methylthioadenosine phosphorylase [Candidatus Melainabacteria bacterium GWF2_37_15]|nr:MAG: methylthioadenosine phosphorylase [Candidatus Melainabacteria bacterium GWF2_37_15]
MFKLPGKKADIGVFGGSGFYNFIDIQEEINVETPYGPPSDSIMLGKIGDKTVAFLPRHGKHHTIPPQAINYRANVWAMKALGVSRLISPCAAGSLQKHVEPGDFVICDQFVNKTYNRKDTFYDGPITTHVSPADPYCPELREIAVKTAKDIGIKVHETGTILVIQGPRFSTKAESKFFTAMGWEVINMTQYPEVYLAREMELCTLNISLITDYDSGLVGDVEPVSHSEVLKVFNANNEKLRKLLFALIEQIPGNRNNCGCSTVLEHSRI